MISLNIMQLRKYIIIPILLFSFNVYATKATQIDVKEGNFSGNFIADADTTVQDLLEQADQFAIPSTTDDLTEGTTNTYNPFGLLIEEDEMDISNTPTVDYYLKWNGTKFEWSFNDDVGAIWGQITGTLSDQTDLQSALDEKLATESDPIYSAWDKTTGISITESQISDLQSYLTVELDPGVTTHESTYNHINYNTAYNHSQIVTGNPHTVIATEVGLGNVDNTSDTDKPISIATQIALDLKVDENAAITGATKTKITYDAKGLVTSGTDATTSDIADSTDKRYITDAALAILGNTSGTNTGDQDLSGYAPLFSAGTNLAFAGSVLNTLSDNEIQDLAWDVLNSPYPHLLVTYDTGTNLVDFVIDEALNNYDWSNVVDAHIPDDITIGSGGNISEDALPSNVLFTGDISSKAKLDDLINATLLESITEFSGDISGTYDATSVDAIIGRTVDDTDLANGKIMMFNSATENFEFVDSDSSDTGLYAGTFVDANLTAGVLTIAHAFNLDANYKIQCIVYDNNKNEILTDETTYIDLDSIEIDLSSYGTISGTWSFVVIGDGATAVPRSIIVKESDGSPSASNVTTLQFDQNTGLHVVDLGGGIVEISIGSHWYDIEVAGQDTLTPTGEETWEIIAGDNVTITTDTGSTPQSMTITSLGVGGGSSNRIYQLDSEVKVTDVGDGYVELIEDGNIVGLVDNEKFTIQDDAISILEIKETTADSYVRFIKEEDDEKFTLINGLRDTDLESDWAINFNADSFVRWTNMLDSDIAFPFSISAVVKYNSWQPVGTRTGAVITSTDGSVPTQADAAPYGFRIRDGESGILCIESCNAGAGGLYPYRRWCTNTGVISIGVVKQVLAVWRDYNDVDLFLNGIEVSISPPYWYAGNGTTVAPGPTGPTVGGSHYYTDEIKYPFDGTVDEVAFFDADKSADIDNFYADNEPQRISLSEPNLIFLAHLDEGTGSTTTDSVSSNLGTHYERLGISPWIQVTNADWVAGFTGELAIVNVTLIESYSAVSGTGTTKFTAFDSDTTKWGDVELDGNEVMLQIEGVTKAYIANDGGFYMVGLKTGTSQIDSGASQNELWIDSSSDYTLKLGQ